MARKGKEEKSKKVKSAACMLVLIFCMPMAVVEIVETDLYDAGNRL